jgi:type IV secretion system protein VirB8
MSSPDVAAAYTGLHNPKSPTSPFNVYGKNKAIRVKILSISLIGGSAKTWPKGATVRFQRSLYDKPTGTSKPLDSNIATMEFTYKSNLKMEEKYRIENPLGFQVTNYRVDRDYDDSGFTATPPDEMEVQPPQQAAPNPAMPGAEPVGPGAMPGDAADPTIQQGNPAPATPPAATPSSNNANGAINQ